jgi:hypothetical protein
VLLLCWCVDQSKLYFTTGTDEYVTRVIIYYSDRFELCYMCFPYIPSTLTVLRDAIYFKYKSLRYADPESCILLMSWKRG